MAQTLVALLVHVVFSTKNRANLIGPEIETELYSYVGGILKGCGSRLIAAGGTSNHVHLLISLSKNDALPAMMQELKKSTSKWIKTRDTSSAGFQWQEGYGAFTIGASQIPVLRSYLARQKLHHQKRGFEDEFLSLVEKYGVDHDPEYLWG
jgi:REP element-mobilizing transposase RayT